ETGNVLAHAGVASFIAVAVLLGKTDDFVEIAVAPAFHIGAGHDDHWSLFHLGLLHGCLAQARALFSVAHHQESPGLKIVGTGSGESRLKNFLEVILRHCIGQKTRRGSAILDGLGEGLLGAGAGYLRHVFISNLSLSVHRVLRSLSVRTRLTFEFLAQTFSFQTWNDLIAKIGKLLYVVH